MELFSFRFFCYQIWSTFAKILFTNSFNLRQLIVFFMMMAFLAQSFSKAFIIVDYYANTAAFEQDCENKAMPEMQCHGKCQMQKKIAQEEKKDQNSTDRKAENKSEIVSTAGSFTAAITYPNPTLIKITRQLYQQRGKSLLLSSDFFQPPRA